MEATDPGRSRTHPTTMGILLGAWLFAESLEPSLLARSWLFQGVLAGVATALGYGLGAAISRLARAAWRQRPLPHSSRARALLRVLALGYAAWAALRAVPQHRWTWDRLGYERSSFWLVYGGSLIVAGAVLAALLASAWLLRAVWARITRFGARMLPRWIAGGLALVLVAWAVLAALNTFVLRRSLDGLNAAFAAGDRDLDGAPEPPRSLLRSGGPRSTVAWAEVGHEGRRFLTRGPTVDDLAAFATSDVVEPIRVYVGRASAEGVHRRVALAMAELARLGAFERRALLVVVPTGTGWVNEQIVQPLEYFHAGDVATVAVQYSHLPSPLAFVSEADAAGETAVALLSAVERRIDQAPGAGPDLYVAGESLGSFGASRAFESLTRSRERTDGAVWVGPPETMHLRREAERRRRPGSPQVKPVVGDGRDFVFVNRTADLARVGSRRPHSVFLQQADDPIVWWDWELAYREPDWLREPLDPAVNPAMEWTPAITFLQLAVDMAVSNDFDEDHGHRYGTQPLTAWHAIVRPDGWDEARTEGLRARLERVAR